MIAAQLTSRILAILEIALAALLGVLCLGFAKQLLFPGESPPADQGGWAAFGLTLALPAFLAFGTAGITLLYSFRGRWAFQVLPLLGVAWVLMR